MTDQQLRKYADTALKMAQFDLTHTGGVTPRIWVVHPGSGVPIPAELPDGAADALNSGRGKARIFSAFREMIAFLRAQCALFVSEAWLGEVTDKADAMDKAEWTRRMDDCEQGMADLVRDGLIVRTEAILVNVQTREVSMMLEQSFERDDATRSIRFGKTRWGVADVTERMRMFPKAVAQ